MNMWVGRSMLALAVLLLSARAQDIHSHVEQDAWHAPPSVPSQPSAPQTDGPKVNFYGTRLSLPSADPEHAERVFKNFTKILNSTDFSNFTQNLVTTLLPNLQGNRKGPEGRSTSAPAISMQDGLIQYTQNMLTNILDEALELALNVAYFLAPNATESLLRTLGVEDEPSVTFFPEGRSADTLGKDFLKLVAGASKKAHHKCPPDWDTYRNCFYVNSVDYVTHVSERWAAFMANLFGYRSKI
ncbi:uncharacterized protein LOC108666330 isoform X2 [Hyalella azteca]|uniref:Uncharacterized protein LOC108666330 isoform X2 n=1 Tax=Hyalella azteca TaxID=294128 RepID=A0A8B7N4Y2_HYAAZ|nr:uncharacterized protein LOC108666330 isoform X2 [Hyalella azteca]